MTRDGGHVVVAQLERHGVEIAFCVPGESYIPVLDAFHDSPIRLISCRHEAAAANMAEACGKLTGRPGVCLVTRGPGATHASVGLHTAHQDSTPLVLLVGQVARPHLGREAFQELDYGRVFAGMLKWAAQADDARRIPELLGRAFAVASAGRPGPVLVALPEDVLAEEVDVPDATPSPPERPRPGESDLARFQALLAAAERPLAIVGEGGWSEQAAEDMLAFAEANRLPVAASFRCQDYIDNRAPVYAGPLTVAPDPRLAQRVRDADLVVAVGGRLGDVTTVGYTLLDVPRPAQRLVHVHPAAEELGVVYQPDLAIVSGLPEFAAAARALEPVDSAGRDGWREAARSDYLANLEHPPPAPGVDLSEVMAFLRGRLPDDAILTSGAGNYTVWAHRFYEFSRYGTQLAPRSGAMGYGVPAAVAAKALRPQAVVVCLAGDGDFLMSGQELATAVLYDLPIVVLVVNNGMYGTIRMHQERQFPGRVVGTDLANPDFAAYAEAFGSYGEVVERTEQLEEAFERALAAGRPAVLELRVDRERITPRATIAELREGAR